MDDALSRVDIRDAVKEGLFDEVEPPSGLEPETC
jgi:hypothetical protein